MSSNVETHHKIIIGDCRDMRAVPDKSVHLVVTSPPYPMIEMWDDMFKMQDERIKNEFERFIDFPYDYVKSNL